MTSPSLPGQADRKWGVRARGGYIAAEKSSTRVEKSPRFRPCRGTSSSTFFMPTTASLFRMQTHRHTHILTLVHGFQGWLTNLMPPYARPYLIYSSPRRQCHPAKSWDHSTRTTFSTVTVLLVLSECFFVAFCHFFYFFLARPICPCKFLSLSRLLQLWNLFNKKK